MSTFMEHIHRDIDESAGWRPWEYDPAPSDNGRPEERLTPTPIVHADAVGVRETEHFLAFDSRPPPVDQ